jgi:hypothetical protein
MSGWSQHLAPTVGLEDTAYMMPQTRSNHRANSTTANISVSNTAQQNAPTGSTVNASNQNTVTAPVLEPIPEGSEPPQPSNLQSLQNNIVNPEEEVIVESDHEDSELAQQALDANQASHNVHIVWPDLRFPEIPLASTQLQDTGEAEPSNRRLVREETANQYEAMFQQLSQEEQNYLRNLRQTASWKAKDELLQRD